MSHEYDIREQRGKTSKEAEEEIEERPRTNLKMVAIWFSQPL